MTTPPHQTPATVQRALENILGIVVTTPKLRIAEMESALIYRDATHDLRIVRKNDRFGYHCLSHKEEDEAFTPEQATAHIIENLPGEKERKDIYLTLVLVAEIYHYEKARQLKEVWMEEDWRASIGRLQR